MTISIVLRFGTNKYCFKFKLGADYHEQQCPWAHKGRSPTSLSFTSRETQVSGPNHTLWGRIMQQILTSHLEADTAQLRGSLLMSPGWPQGCVLHMESEKTVLSRHTCGGQRSACRNRFLLATIWVPETELRSSGLEATIFTHRAVLVALIH